MAAVNYKVVRIDLAAARAFQVIPEISVGVLYDGVTVIQLPGVGAASLAFGPSGDLIPLLVQGQGFNFKDVCDNPFPASDGLFISNPAGAGILILLVSMPNQPAS